MNKEKVLLICNKNILDSKEITGGVVKCSKEFIELIEGNYEIINIPVELDKSLRVKIKKKLGIDVYDQYNPHIYLGNIKRTIAVNSIKYVFLNMSDTMVFAKALKQEYGDKIKTILLSHGNESGDFLHECTRFKEYMSFPKNYTYKYKLSAQIEMEYMYRLNYLDLILTVSEIESAIEENLAAKMTLFIPRVIKEVNIDYKPSLDKVGFFGDLTHYPNYDGVEKICKELLKNSLNIELRLVGKYDEKINALKMKYPFITILGFLDYKELITEVSTWSFFLNLVFYYSKGVSTKLAEAISWGIPTITTIYGNRGYQIENNGLLTVSNPAEMAELIGKYYNDFNFLSSQREKILKVLLDSPTIKDLSYILKKKLESLN